MTTRPDVDLIVAGAGPAGVAAAVMAASLHLSTLLVEATAIGSKLTAIGALDNVPGNWTTGPDLATALEQDITRHQQTGRLTLLTARAHRVTGHAASGFHLDAVYHALFVRPVQAGADLARFLDREVVDTYVRGAGTGTQWLGRLVRRAQTGNVQTYLSWLLAGSTVLVAAAVVLSTVNAGS
nr:FAD-dependent oxidoreductase [Streptomyces clavuligerus]